MNLLHDLPASLANGDTYRTAYPAHLKSTRYFLCNVLAAAEANHCLVRLTWEKEHVYATFYPRRPKQHQLAKSVEN